MEQPALCATVGPVQHMEGGLAGDEAELTCSNFPPFVCTGPAYELPRTARFHFSDGFCL